MRSGTSSACSAGRHRAFITVIVVAITPSCGGLSAGFHSGSGKSAENYGVCGRATEGNLEVKTSGRYTYEMGRALYASPDATDQALWSDW
jgi:hypothetical protein